MKTKTCLSFLALCVAFATSCLGQQAMTPAEKPSPSPKGKYLFALHEDRTDAMNPVRTLVILDARNHAILFRWRVERSAELVWYPDDSEVAILDYFGSNETEFSS